MITMMVMMAMMTMLMVMITMMVVMIFNWPACRLPGDSRDRLECRQFWSREKGEPCTLSSRSSTSAIIGTHINGPKHFGLMIIFLSWSSWQNYHYHHNHHHQVHHFSLTGRASESNLHQAWSIRSRPWLPSCSGDWLIIIIFKYNHHQVQLEEVCRGHLCNCWSWWFYSGVKISRNHFLAIKKQRSSRKSPFILSQNFYDPWVMSENMNICRTPWVPTFLWSSLNCRRFGKKYHTWRTILTSCKTFMIRVIKEAIVHKHELYDEKTHE